MLIRMQTATTMFPDSASATNPFALKGLQAMPAGLFLYLHLFLF